MIKIEIPITTWDLKPTSASRKLFFSFINKKGILIFSEMQQIFNFLGDFSIFHPKNFGNTDSHEFVNKYIYA